MRVELPIKTVSENNIKGGHWGKRAGRTSSQRDVTRLALQAHFGKPPAPPLVVLLTRIAPRKLDGDNNQGALKAVRDGVADWLGIDDGADCVTWTYGQEQGAPKAYAVRVEVSERVEREPVSELMQIVNMRNVSRFMVTYADDGGGGMSFRAVVDGVGVEGNKPRDMSCDAWLRKVLVDLNINMN